MACGATLKRSLEFDPLHSPQSTRSPKRRRCMPMTLSPNTPPTKSHQTNPSPFGEVSPNVTSEQIAANLALEIRRMQRRRQLHYGSRSPPPGSSPPPHLQDVAAVTEQHASDLALTSPNSSNHPAFISTSKKDVPLFTMRQVGLVCERMLREREQQIREAYDKVLTNKIAEQYEAFLKFNHDQIQRRMGEKPASYYS